jgi:hypothetical protein
MTDRKVYTEKDVAGCYNNLKHLKTSAPRQEGAMAATWTAVYRYDGKEWTLISTDQHIMFKVVKRTYIAGRGHITVVYNPDLLPISTEKSAVCKGQYRLPIHGIDIQKTLAEHPETLPEWGLVTSEETTGENIIIRMYPDEG